MKTGMRQQGTKAKDFNCKERREDKEFNLFGSIPHNLLHKSYSQPSKSLSFPNASIGNPSETLTGPPIKTFGGDNFGINSHKCFLIPETLCTTVRAKPPLFSPPRRGRCKRGIFRLFYSVAALPR